MLFPIRKLFWILVSIVIALLAIYTFNTMSIHFLPEELPGFFLTRFDINGETNIPAWYSTVLLFSVAVAAFFNLRMENNRSDSLPAQRVFWRVLLIIFCFMSLDEAAMLHEIVDRQTSIKWIFVYAPLGFLFFLYCLYFWWTKRKEDRQPGFWIIGGMILFFVGAGFMEWISYTFELPYAFQRIEYVLEEGLEMLGSSWC